MSLKSYLAGAIALAAFAVPTTASAIEIGPDPTISSIQGNGTLAYSRLQIADSATPGFGQATIFAPTDTSRTYGAVAIAPGFTETTSAVSWLGPRLASQGFAVIVFNVTNTFTDLPGARASQLLRALDYFSTQSPYASRIDKTRTAVAGHSMGGGGAIEAAKRRPALKGAVALAPWHTTTGWGSVTVPTMIIGAQNDIIAPVGQHGFRFYNTLPATTPKAYFEYAGGDHFVTNAPTPTVTAETVAWLKRFVDGDTRYSQFIWPSATGATAGKTNRYLTNGPF